MGLMLTARTWGRGEVPVLFLHGFTGSRHAFDHLEAELGDVVRATCVDLPGHHGAPLPAQQGEAGFREVVEAVRAVAPGPCVVVGYSQGARVALALALAYPQVVRQVVLESCMPGLRQRKVRRQRAARDEQQAEGLLAQGVGPFIDRWEHLPLFAGLRALPEADRASLRARRLAHTAEGLAGALRCMGQGVQPDLWPSLPSLRAPVLLVTGAADAKYTLAARRMAAELPQAWRVSFPGVGHAPHLECPQAWAAELRSFLQAGWPSDLHLTQEQCA